MIDSELRRKLSQDLRRLVTGRITNDEFDDAYYEFYRSFGDLAVREISRFGWSLYGDLLLPYRLRGKHAVNAAARRRAAHAVVFLQPENEYVYPESPSSFAEMSIGCAWSFGLQWGIAFLVVGGLASIGGFIPPAAACLLIGAGIIAICLILRRVQLDALNSFRENCDHTGDMKIWPFTDGEALANANGNGYLLSNFEPDVVT